MGSNRLNGLFCFMWYFFHVSEDNASVLCYTVSNCPVRSRSYITLIMTGRALHGHFKKCCEVCLVCEILDVLYFLECSRLCYFEYALIKASSLLLSTEAGSHLTEKKETWWGRWLQRTSVPSEYVPFTWEMCFLKICIPACKRKIFQLTSTCCFSFTFFDSKTQWLFPSSSIWFHHRSPTNNLPDTFWGKNTGFKAFEAVSDMVLKIRVWTPCASVTYGNRNSPSAISSSSFFFVCFFYSQPQPTCSSHTQSVYMILLLCCKKVKKKKIVWHFENEWFNN